MSLLLSFIITCLIIESTPGPNMAYLAILSATEGRRSGFLVVSGIALGLFTIGLAASLGVAAVVMNSPLMYQALRWCGVIYLFWLAWDAWSSVHDTGPEQTIPWRDGQLFRRGLITNILNPKAFVFYVAVLPEFVTDDKAVLAETIRLMLIYVFIATAMHLLIVLLSSLLHKFFSKPKQVMLLRRVLALLLAGVAVWFAFSTGRTIS